jgi:FtsP/CotA-like multicopper oxidase with cupredoxin domain
MQTLTSLRASLCLASALTIAFGAGSSRAAIDGVNGSTFELYASPGYVDTPDGNSLLVWGYALEGEPMQYPGPTLIVREGQTVTISISATSSRSRPPSYCRASTASRRWMVSPAL